MLAGAFGSYIDTSAALAIGMLPACEPDRVTSVGNAAGDGALLALLALTKRREAEWAAETVEYVELASVADFQRRYMEAMRFEASVELRDNHSQRRENGASMSLLDLLNSERKTIFLDGAMGTQLGEAGLEMGGQNCVTHPEAVLAVHQKYAACGIDLLITNTLTMNRVNLGAHRVELDVREVNLAGARLAKQAALPGQYVLGDISSTGKLLKPYGPLAEEDAYAAFKEQASILAEGGVDGFVVETMTDLREALCAVRAVREASALPVLASMSFKTAANGGRTIMGNTARDCASSLAEAGACAVGANCGELDPLEMAQVVALMREATTVPIIAQPNAGKVQMVDMQPVLRHVTGRFRRGRAGLRRGRCPLGRRLLRHIARPHQGSRRPVGRAVSVTSAPGSLRTPLYARHVALGARMVDFAGWDMPLNYPAGVVAEHLTTRRLAGLFDVSHMGRFSVQGPDAVAYLRRVLSNDAATLPVGRAHYTLLSNEAGGAIDDAYLYRFSADAYLLVVNASNRQKDWQHLSAQTGVHKVELQDITERVAMISAARTRVRRDAGHPCSRPALCPRRAATPSRWRPSPAARCSWDAPATPASPCASNSSPQPSSPR